MSLNTPSADQPTEEQGTGAPVHAQHSLPLPQVPQPPRKSIFKRWWFWLTVGLATPVVGLFVLILFLVTVEVAVEDAIDTTQTQSGGKTSENNSKVKNPGVPAEYRAALRQAQSYADTMHMSKTGIYEMLIDPNVDQFSKKAAEYAIENVEADWKENALLTAIDYQETDSMSPKMIRQMLVSKDVDKFTAEEADYAMEHLPE